jgi:hypothetical protein
MLICTVTEDRDRTESTWARRGRYFDITAGGGLLEPGVVVVSRVKNRIIIHHSQREVAIDHVQNTTGKVANQGAVRRTSRVHSDDGASEIESRGVERRGRINRRDVSHSR